MLALRALTRLVTGVLLAVLAVAGAAVAVCSIAPDGLPWLADQLRLPELRDEVAGFLATLEAPGPVAWRSALAGLAAVVVGLLLLAGALWPRRQRLALLDAGAPGTLGATRRALGRAAASLVDGVRELTARRVRLRPRRRGPGARLHLRVMRPETVSSEEARQRADQALQPLAQSFALRTRIRTRAGSRVI